MPAPASSCITSGAWCQVPTILLVFSVTTALSVAVRVRMMITGLFLLGSSERREELQAVMLRHVSGHLLVILLVLIVSKALSVVVLVGMMMITGFANHGKGGGAEGVALREGGLYTQFISRDFISAADLEFSYIKLIEK